ncbi:MAG: hypothetical protein J5741_00100 [Bacteroidales bacterium]|nr:hypothetical protein [Bacteroidales bacterium]
MKKILTFLLPTLLLLSVSCDTPSRKVTGDYSYKQSGLVTFTDEENHTVSTLATKQGQMNIMLDRHGKKGDVLITFNEMGGGAHTCTGKIQGDSIFFAPYEFTTRFSISDSLAGITQVGEVYTVQSAGRGIICDDMILVEEQWTGRPEDGTQIRLHAEKITILAEKN